MRLFSPSLSVEASVNDVERTPMRVEADETEDANAALLGSARDVRVRYVRSTLAAGLVAGTLLSAAMLLMWRSSAPGQTAVVQQADDVQLVRSGAVFAEGKRGRTYRGVNVASTSPAASIFCFSVISAVGPEFDMAKEQIARGLSIQGCNEWAFFSDKEVEVGDNLYAIGLGSTPAERGPVPGAPQYQQWYNTPTFLKAWKWIADDGVASRHAWTVKVDTDAVFLPGRLQQMLYQAVLALQLPDLNQLGPCYVENCVKFNSMQGPLEIFSRQAVELFFARRSQCVESIALKSGEDLFMLECMKSLEVPVLQTIDAKSVLKDHYCDWSPSCKTADITPACASCAEAKVAAYHPFKSTMNYIGCLQQTEALGI